MHMHWDSNKLLNSIISSVPYLTEEEAKQALAQFVSEHCCYGSGPVKNLTISNMQSSNTYRVNFLVFDKYVQLMAYIRYFVYIKLF
jgi:hypothetical protein